jgi:hypothetical protein
LRRRHHHLFGEELGAAVPLLGSGRRRFGPFQAGQVLVDFPQFLIEHDQTVGCRLLAVVEECPLALKKFG